MWVCASSLSCISNYIYPNVTNQPMTSPSTGLRRGCLSDTARSNCNTAEARGDYLLPARSTAIPARSMTPPFASICRFSWPSRQIARADNCTCNSFACFSHRPFSFPHAAYRRLSHRQYGPPRTGPRLARSFAPACGSCCCLYRT